MHAVRKFLLAVALLALGRLTALATDPPTGLPSPGTALAPLNPPHWLAEALDGLWTAAVAAASHPALAGTVLAVLLLPGFVAFLVRLVPRRIHKDPQRLYTNDQRRVAADRAGGRCEMESLLFTRCRRPGNAGDHWFPHSLGGATSMDNQVWACTPCNSSKGARVPTFWETTRLEWRRRRYFPTGPTLRPGGKYARG